jgi:hypothetical protein
VKITFVQSGESPFGDSHSATMYKVYDDTSYTLDDIKGYKLYTDNVTPSYTGTAPNGHSITYANATLLSMVAGGSFQATMGGMQLLDMAAQRDNYFAGIWAIGSQWGNNYNKSATYNGQTYYTYPYDGIIITNPNWQNWYYSISDDNILATNMTGDVTATGYWNQAQTLFSTLAKVKIPYAAWDPTTTSAADESALLKTLVETPSALGIYWNALANGDHKSTWIYAHGISYSDDWLLSQTKQSEDARGKLNLSGSYANGLGTDGYNSISY